MDTITNPQFRCSECLQFYPYERLVKVADVNPATGRLEEVWHCCPDCRKPGMGMIEQWRDYKARHGMIS